MKAPLVLDNNDVRARITAENNSETRTRCCANGRSPGARGATNTNDRLHPSSEKVLEPFGCLRNPRIEHRVARS